MKFKFANKVPPLASSRSEKPWQFPVSERRPFHKRIKEKYVNENWESIKRKCKENIKRNKRKMEKEIKERVHRNRRDF